MYYFSICFILIGNEISKISEIEWLKDPLRKFHKRKRGLEIITKIVVIIIVTWQIVLICLNVSDMLQGNYKSVDININKCKIYSLSDKSMRSYYIDISNDISIRLNRTQYYQLEELKEKYPNANINIKYLETTELFLTYEKLDSK